MAIITLNNNSLSSISSLPAGVGGKVLQVVTNTHATRFTTSSTSYVAATGYTVAITPSATSSKVFLCISSHIDTQDSTRAAYATIYRTVSGGSATDIIGDAEGIGVAYSGGARIYTPITLSALDSPNTTSEVTYQVYVKSNVSSNISFNDAEGEAQLTAFEIAG
jgi:hypothetical protein